MYNEGFRNFDTLNNFEKYLELASKYKEKTKVELVSYYDDTGLYARTIVVESDDVVHLDILVARYMIDWKTLVKILLLEHFRFKYSHI